MALFAFIIALQGCETDSAKPLSYTIQKSKWDTLPALNVKVSFKPDPSGTTLLHYPDNAWGQDSLWNALKDVDLTIGEGRLEINRDSGWVAIRHEPEASALFEVTYKLIQDKAATGGRSDLTYRPIIQPDYFHVFAHNLFMVPGHYRETSDSTLQARLEWVGWAPEEQIHNSFGTGQLVQEIGPIPPDRFMSAIYTGGDFEVFTDTLEGNALHLAIRGDWVPFQKTEVMDLLTKTVRVQRDFWRDHSQSYFTVIMRPINQKQGSSFQGTGLTNSFACSISNNENTGLEQLVYLFNHELMHNWIGHTIQNEEEEAQYWFSEGFTEYYTAKNIAANGIAGYGWGYYIGNINEKVRLLAGSPVREAPNSDINYENFWSNPEYNWLPYHRGALFAFYLDQRIRAHSQGTSSLDDLMRDLLEEVRRSGARLNGELLVRLANPYLGADLQPDFDRYIEKGEMLPLGDLYRELGLEYSVGADLFDLGFAFAGDRANVQSVDTASEAYRAGLREGDALMSYSIQYDVPEKQVELKILRDGREIPISYYPRKRIDIVQLGDSPTNRDKFGG